MELVALEKIRFPEFNQNMIVDERPALIIDSTNLHYDIIFGSNFLDKCGITLDYENHLVQWMEYNIPLRDAMEFFPIVITLHYSHHLNLNLNRTLLSTQFLTPLPLAFLTLNMSKPMSTMLHLTNITFHLINGMIFSTSKSYLMARLESIPIKMVHIDLKHGAKLVHHCTYPVPHIHRQTIKRNLNTWLSLAYLNHVGPLNGHPQPSLSLKKMAKYNKLQTYVHSIKLSFENNTPYKSSPTCLIASLDTNSLPNLTSQCNTTLSNLTNQAKSVMSLSGPLANTNTNISLWDSNVPLTLPRKSWTRYYMMLKTPVLT